MTYFMNFLRPKKVNLYLMFEAVHEHEGERCRKNITNLELKYYSSENGANNNCFVASLVCSCNI